MKLSLPIYIKIFIKSDNEYCTNVSDGQTDGHSDHHFELQSSFATKNTKNKKRTSILRNHDKKVSTVILFCKQMTFKFKLSNILVHVLFKYAELYFVYFFRLGRLQLGYIEYWVASHWNSKTTISSYLFLIKKICYKTIFNCIVF